MSSGLSRLTASHNAQLITTAVVSGVVVGTAILGFQQARRMLKVENVKASIPDINEDHQATKVFQRSFVFQFKHSTHLLFLY